MIVVGYTAVLGLLVYGAFDLVAASRSRDPERLKRAKLAGGAAWMFGVASSALALGTGFSGIGAAPPEQQAVILSETIRAGVGPGLLGTLGGMALATVATVMGRPKA